MSAEIPDRHAQNKSLHCASGTKLRSEVMSDERENNRRHHVHGIRQRQRAGMGQCQQRTIGGGLENGDPKPHRHELRHPARLLKSLRIKHGHKERRAERQPDHGGDSQR